MQIRLASHADAGSVAPLLTQLGYPVTPERLAARFERVVGSEVDTAWVALDPSGGHGDRDGTVIGFAAGHLFWPYELDAPVAELTALVVDEERRGSGAGRALVAAFEDWVIAAGGIRASVATAFRREGAHAFYERLGYRQLAKKYEKSL